MVFWVCTSVTLFFSNSVTGYGMGKWVIVRRSAVHSSFNITPYLLSYSSTVRIFHTQRKHFKAVLFLEKSMLIIRQIVSVLKMRTCLYGSSSIARRSCANTSGNECFLRWEILCYSHEVFYFILSSTVTCILLHNKIKLFFLCFPL